MTVKEARKILGKDAEGLSDYEIQVILKLFNRWAEEVIIELTDFPKKIVQK